MNLMPDCFFNKLECRWYFLTSYPILQVIDTALVLQLFPKSLYDETYFCVTPSYYEAMWNNYQNDLKVMSK